MSSAQIMRLKLFPAIEGDCLLLEVPTVDTQRRILIDGGRTRAFDPLCHYLEGLSEPERLIDLFIVTHIDADHIAGALKFARQSAPPAKVAGVWFNAYHHLQSLASAGTTYQSLGPAQGDKLSDAILHHKWPWNRAFGEKAATVSKAGDIVELEIDDLRFFLISPDHRKLRHLEREWATWIIREGVGRGTPDPVDPPPGLKRMGALPVPDVEALARTPDTCDTTAANGSSLAFLVDAGGKRALLTGDAHPDLLEAGVGALAAREGGRLRVDLLKVSHHGSRENTTTKLLSLLDCTRFVISTNGARHSHPHQETIAKILKSSTDHKILYFNYRQENTNLWDNNDLKKLYNYSTVFPDAKDGVLNIPV